MADDSAKCSRPLLLCCSLLVVNVIVGLLFVAMLMYNFHHQCTCECSCNTPIDQPKNEDHIRMSDLGFGHPLTRVPRGDISGLGNLTYCTRIAAEVVTMKQHASEFVDIIRSIEKALSSSCFENDSKVTLVYRNLLWGVHQCRISVEDTVAQLNGILESFKPKQRRRSSLKNY